MKRRTRSLAVSIALLAGRSPLRATALDLPGTEPPPADLSEEALPVDRTPPRLSHIDGRASFWRDGADDWTAARVNTPLAPGDQLYVDNASNLELQIGSRDFLRAASNSQLAFDNEESDYQQFRLRSGEVSLDLRSLRPGQVVELDTPNAAFTIDRSGYYRARVDADATRFTARRGGRAIVTSAGGDPEEITSSGQIVVRGDDVERYAASEPDAWDHWNDERSDQLIQAVSYRYVPDGVYGVDDLDHNGRWRVVPDYGSVWFPSRVATNWAPYTTGQWVQDPYYGSTWVDDAPWGWAPFHHGRWVFVGGFWGWAPGPLVARPYYAPALVAFFSAGPVSIGVSLGMPLLGWTPLGWGEPCRPWWGPQRFAGTPRWFGWGGPRVAIHNTVIHDVHVYRNTRARNGMVFVDRERFGRGPVSRSRIASNRFDRLRPVDGALPIRADAARVAGGAARGARAPRAVLDRRVVATRPAAGTTSRRSRRDAGVTPDPTARIVPSPRDARVRGTVRRDPSGAHAEARRAGAPPPPRSDTVRRGDAAGRGPDVGRAQAPSRATRDARAAGAQNARPERPERSADVRRPPAASRRTRSDVDRRAAQRTPTRGAAPPAQAERPQPQRAAPRRAEGARPGAARVTEQSQPSRSPQARASQRTEQSAAPRRSESARARASRRVPGPTANPATARRAGAAVAVPQANARREARPQRQTTDDRTGRARRQATEIAADSRATEADDAGARVAVAADEVGR